MTTTTQTKTFGIDQVYSEALKIRNKETNRHYGHGIDLVALRMKDELIRMGLLQKEYGSEQEFKDAIQIGLEKLRKIREQCGVNPKREESSLLEVKAYEGTQRPMQAILLEDRTRKYFVIGKTEKLEPVTADQYAQFSQQQSNLVTLIDPKYF